MQPLEGIDVSKYQGEVNWSAVRAAGKAFAFARVSDGLRVVDPFFDGNWRGMQQVGLIRGVYQMFRASQDPVAQADLLASHVGTLGAGDLGAVLDLELDDGQSVPNVIIGALAWLKRVEEKTGRKPFVYTAHAFYQELGTPKDFEGYPLWVASYAVSKPRLPEVWSRWTFWQYSPTGSCPGVNGQVDLDRFNGTLDALRALAGQGGAAAPTAAVA